MIDHSERISGMASFEYDMVDASTFVSSPAYTGVSVNRCKGDLGTYRGKSFGISTGPPAVRDDKALKLDNGGGFPSS